MRRLLVALFILSFSTFAQKSDNSHPFDYDSKLPLDTQDAGVEFRGSVGIYDVSYASPKGGRVRAYLVLPPGKGPFAAVIWGHWCWTNSNLRNRREFLDEAVALATTGAASLLIDFPIARPGYVEDKDPLSSQQIDDLVQEVVDIRRGADLLLARPFVDAKRLAYVGHSCGASAGGVVSGVDKRFRAFVLMAGSLSDEVITKSPQFQEFRQKLGPAKVDAFLAKYSWSDPGKYISHAAPATLFLQYAIQEKFLTAEMAKATAALASEPKQFKLYDAPHALNGEALRDRLVFLADQLHLQPLSSEAIAAIPALPQPPEPQP
jgi:dienelactone hydrolase